MIEKVRPVLRPGQSVADATGKSCTSCGRAFAEGERGLHTAPYRPPPGPWYPPARPEAWTCAACYAPPPRNERLTDDGRFGGGGPKTSHGPCYPA
jgi:hypothetical protein